MFGGRARAARRAQAEADRLGRQADEYAQQAGQQPSGDRGPAPAGRAYTVEKDGVTFNWSELGVKAMEAAGYDTSEILAGYGAGPELQDAGLDAEIDRLTLTLPPEPGDPSDWRQSRAGSTPHKSQMVKEYQHLSAIANAPGGCVERHVRGPPGWPHGARCTQLNERWKTTGQA